MANASSKRVASANEKALSNLLIGLLGINISALVIRFIFKLIRSTPLFSSKRLIFLQTISTLASIGIWRWFVLIGSTRRDDKGNIRSGDDLGSGGIIELAWDFIYITWICTLGSALLGSWVWYLFLLIPGFGLYKLYTFASPFLSMFLPNIFGPKQPKTYAEAAAEEPSESKRQAKLRARMDKGDKRIQQVQRQQK